MKDGPAFIPLQRGWTPAEAQTWGGRWWHDVPPGYIWQDATNYTRAGWVRPRGKETI